MGLGKGDAVLFRLELPDMFFHQFQPMAESLDRIASCQPI